MDLDEDPSTGCQLNLNIYRNYLIPMPLYHSHIWQKEYKSKDYSQISLKTVMNVFLHTSKSHITCRTYTVSHCFKNILKTFHRLVFKMKQEVMAMNFLLVIL